MNKTRHGTDRASPFIVYNFHDSGIFTEKKNMGHCSLGNLQPQISAFGGEVAGIGN
jgi:hypothetical protein